MALAVRIAVVVASPDYVPRNDAFDYDRHGVSIARGDGYPPPLFARTGPSAFRPPVYPSMLAAVYSVSGTSDDGVRVGVARGVQVALGVAVVWLTWLLGRRIGGSRVGLMAASLAAVSPHLVIAGTALLSDLPFVFLVLGATLLALRARNGEAPRWIVPVVGVAGGVAVLTRSVGVVILPVLAVAVWTGRPRWSARSLLAPLALLATAALVVTPWVMRNSVAFDRFVPPTTQTGLSLAGAYNAEASDQLTCVSCVVWRFPPEFLRLARDPATDEVEQDHALRRVAFAYIADHPLAPVERLLWNGIRLLGAGGPAYERASFADIGHGPDWDAVATASAWAFYPVLALAIVGGIARPARRAPRFVWAVPLALFAAAALVVGTIRYRAPVDPFILVLAALGLDRLVRAARSHRERRPTARPQPEPPVGG